MFCVNVCLVCWLLTRTTFNSVYNEHEIGAKCNKKQFEKGKNTNKTCDIYIYIDLATVKAIFLRWDAMSTKQTCWNTRLSNRLSRIKEISRFEIWMSLSVTLKWGYYWSIEWNRANLWIVYVMTWTEQKSSRALPLHYMEYGRLNWHLTKQKWNGRERERTTQTYFAFLPPS